VRPYSPDSPWDLDPSITFLNHGSYGACPRPVLEFQRALVDELESDPVRFLSREFEGRLDAARESVAAFLNADPEGLVVVPNATTGVATVLASLRLRPGDELLTTDHEYNATLNALASVAERARARVVRASIPLPIRHPEEVVEAILAQVSPRTRIARQPHHQPERARVPDRDDRSRARSAGRRHPR
jgi:isopenicillin-N epimerase